MHILTCFFLAPANVKIDCCEWFYQFFNIFQPLSKFDELDFEYSKDEVVELNRKDNPEEAQKWALKQLAAQKFKIEEELQRMELEALRRQEIEEQELLEQRRIVQLEEQRQLQQLEEQRLQKLSAELAASAKFRPIPQLPDPEPEPEAEIEEILEEPKTPEMSDGEDSDVPEMQIVEYEEDESRSSSKDMVIDEAQTPPEDTPVTEPETACSSPPAKSESDEVFKVPDVEIKPKTPEAAEKQEESVAEEPKLEDKPKEKSKEDLFKKRKEERSKSKDDRQRSDQRKEHSSSSSSSSSNNKRHSSSSSSKSSSHKSSSGSSRHESSSSKSASSSSRSKDEKSSSHR